MLGVVSASACASNTSLTRGVTSSLWAHDSTRPRMLPSSAPSRRYCMLPAAGVRVCCQAARALTGLNACF